MRAESAVELAAQSGSTAPPPGSRLARTRWFEPADLYRIPLWILVRIVYRRAPISLHLRLATFRGTVAFFCTRRRRSVLEAIEHHVDDGKSRAEVRLIARRYVQFRHRSDVARLWPQIRDFAGADQIEVEGLEHLDSALERGKGAILVSSHFGYSRLIKPILRSRGRRALLVGPPQGGSGPQNYPPYYSRLGRLVRRDVLGLPVASSLDGRWNETVGVDLAATMNLRPHIDALSRNQALIILADGRGARAVRRLPVNGIGVRFAPGATSLARDTGAALLPTFVVDDPTRSGPRMFRMVIHPRLDVRITDDRNGDLEQNLTRFARVWEEVARAHPHNWQWSWVRDGELDNPRPFRGRT